MSYITESWLLDTLIILLPVLSILYYLLTSTYSYWRNKNVPFEKPFPGLGSSLPLIRGQKSHADLITDIYNNNEGKRFCGFYQFLQPTLMVRDLNLIERILIKDFSYFEDRGMPLDAENEPLTVNLVNLKGDQWRNLRHKLTPTFSSGKLKRMFQQMCGCGQDLLEIAEEYARTGEAVDTKILTTLFSSDVIASCAFGLQMKSNSEEGNKFREMVNKALGGGKFTALKLGLRFFCPPLAKLLRLRTTPSDVSDYFLTITKATMQHRLKNNVKREDFFQLLLTLKEQEESGSQLDLGADGIDKDDVQLQYTVKPISSENNLKLTDEVITAQTFVFLAAGSETVSSTLSVALFFIAENSDVQTKLQTEVDSVLAKHGGQWTYQALKDMTYLDQVIQESQRMFPMAHAHMRVCTLPYKVPDSDLILDKGTVVVIPAWAIQMDPKYYPNPELFNPDRFVENNFKPSAAFSPFGDGPRICIAMRFAVLEMKVFIARIMSIYSIKTSSKTSTPLRYDPTTFVNRPLGGVWVSFHKRHF